jgi:hypothetical protein
LKVVEGDFERRATGQSGQQADIPWHRIWVHGLADVPVVKGQDDLGASALQSQRVLTLVHALEKV